jgi:mannose-6-phosphate isomerase-like protein (cupin superfamily)
MSSYTKANLRQVEDQAPNFGMPAEMQARFARTPLEGKSLGLSLFTLAPSFRIPFAHKHAHQEEVYVVVRGSARVKVEDEIVELGQWDAIRIDEDTMRAVEAGPGGGRVPRVRRRRRSPRRRHGAGLVERLSTRRMI